MKESPEVGTPEGEMPPSFPPERLEEASTQASPSPGDQAGPAESGAAAGSEDSEPDEDLADDKRLAEDEKRASFLRSSLETLAIVAVALLVSVVIKTFFVQAFYVPSGSMESTLKPGDRIAVNRMVDSAGDINSSIRATGWATSPTTARPGGGASAMRFRRSASSPPIPANTWSSG